MTRMMTPLTTAERAELMGLMRQSIQIAAEMSDALRADDRTRVEELVDQAVRLRERADEIEKWIVVGAA